MLAFSLGEIAPRVWGSNTDHCHPKLEVYPKFILQLTTLGLLFSLSSSAIAVVPAIVSPESPVEVKEEVRIEDYMPISDSENVKRYVSDYFADIPIMIEVARCESQFRQYNSKGEVLRGKQNTSDRGVMQINLHYHEDEAQKLGLDVHKIEDNVAYARYLYEKQGTKPWMASSPCWAKFKESEIAKR